MTKDYIYYKILEMRLFTRLSLLLATVFFSSQLFANDPVIKRTCATHDIVHQHLLENYTPEQLRTITPSARMAGDTTYSVPIVNSDTTYTIQVVVHVVYLDDNKYENPTDEQIQSQIDALNRDFNLENDLGHIRPEFTQFIGNAKIKFELAKVRPNGLPTNGITRTKSKPKGSNFWDPVFLVDNIKKPDLGGVNPWGPRKYLNIWVCDLNMQRRVSPNNPEINADEGILGGYANPPQGLPNWVLNISGIEQNLAMTTEGKQGVVIDFRFFGQNPEYVKDYFNGSPHYSLGRTAVHEVGHYLGLRHSWGDGNAYELLNPGFDKCTVDDGIKDTPNENEPYSNFIESGNVCGVNVNSCNVPYPGDGIDYPDMRENYMNYSTDVCYGMFTKEQVNMMRFALTNKRADIVNKREVESVATPVKHHQLLDVSIHPNPASDQLTLQIHNGNNSSSKVQIFNSLGARVRQQTIPAGMNESKISVQDLATGVYLIYVENDDKAFIKQFVKQ